MQPILKLTVALLIAGSAGAFGQMTREDLANRIESNARWLSSQGVEYNRSWLPPGATQALAMDCSNTVKWFYADATGHALPRTASSQYEQLRQQRRLWRVNALNPFWQSRLKPGDLLFWENTYKPKRKPPVTHVMVYLGRNADGSMRMAGSQGSRGVDVYTFKPEVPYGGYNWFLWFKKKGKFVAYGRPL